MSDLVAEVLFTISALVTIVVMLLIIAKERRKSKVEAIKKARKQERKFIHSKSDGLFLD